jgi:hypothetical protein
MNKSILAIAAFVALASIGTARADAIPGSKRDVAGWLIGAYDDNRAKFSHCAMSTPYKSGITMYFSISGDYSWRVGWSHEQWRFRKGQSVDLSVYVDGVGPHTLKAMAISEKMALAELPAKAAVFDLMRKGYNMKVYAEGRTYGFNLDGTYAALTEILSCVDRYTGVATPRPVSPPAPMVSQGSQSSPRPVQSTDVTPEQKIEATKVVANILAQGDMTSFRILTAKEIVELKNDYVSRSHVVWRAEGLLGTLRILTDRNINLGEMNSAIIGEDVRACKGKFASGSVADEKSRSVLRLFTACEEDGQTYEFRYTIVPAGDGTHYLFATIGRAEGGNQAGRVAKVESALRQAVYEVMKE